MFKVGDEPKKSFFRYENGVVLMMFFTFGFVFMERLSVVYLFPFLGPDLKFNNAELGLIVSVLAICWSLSGFVFGTISDFIGSRKNVLLPITLAFSLFSFLSGIAKSFGAMLSIRALMGVSEGPVLPIAQASVIADSSEERRGFNMGFVQSSLGLIGSTVGPLVLTFVATKYSWHAGFYIAGIPGLIMFFVLLFWMKDPNKRMSKEQLAKHEHRLRREDYPVIFRTRNIWITMAIAALMMTWLFAFTTFAPTFLVEYDKYTGPQMGMITAAMGLGTFFWGFMGPYISDKWGRKPTLVLFSFVAVLSPVCLALIHGSVLVMSVIGFLTCAGQACFPLFMVVVPGESLSPKYVGTAVGLVQMVGELIGGTAIPSIAGVAADHFGLQAPLWIAAAGAAVSGFIAFTLKETAPVRRRSARNTTPSMSV
ncbi:major facilitator superfamily MFS [Alicyclobacillus hesperidum URH17-3-68]|uniref:Sugar phosphate permease n=1 Tax=Alicyclobacillus hesperidum TaxID=89784 RepID=A0A1H2WXV4_9BACL|nr:major facilitator superfamily MFS [Alicyclobacillus hesperidum URH17-3-68]SDW85348.1 Sugar phosphate permease [Alicyclobacillus hesperidum]